MTPELRAETLREVEVYRAGYVRGVEDAATIVDTEFGYIASDAMVARIRELAKQEAAPARAEGQGEP